MTRINEVQLNHFKETENRRHNEEIRDLKAKNLDQYRDEVKQNEEMITRMRNEYDSKQQKIQAETERKLVELRRNQERTLAQEKKRLEQEMSNLKKTHEGQVVEIKKSQSHEISEIQESHQKTLDNARQKYLIEKAKWQPA